MGVWQDFKTFASKGSFATMAVGIVIGLAVTTVVMSLVSDLVNPLIGLALPGNLNDVGNVVVLHSTFAFGAFASAVINFLVVLVVVFFAIVYPLAKQAERAAAKQAQAPPTMRDCPECCSSISVNAKRCAYCAAPVTPTAAPAAPAPAS